MLQIILGVDLKISKCIRKKRRYHYESMKEEQMQEYMSRCAVLVGICLAHSKKDSANWETKHLELLTAIGNKNEFFNFQS